MPVIVLWIMAAVFGHQPPSSTIDNVQQPASSSASKPVLDFDYFKTQVQPIFLAKREGYTRCIVCHSSDAGRAAFYATVGQHDPGFLQKLSAGATTWNEEQSRRNFESVSRMVTPGEPMKSLLLLRPLDPAAGGNEFHSGGRHFKSQDDPAFKTLAAWVRGQTASGK